MLVVAAFGWREGEVGWGAMGAFRGVPKDGNARGAGADFGVSSSAFREGEVES